MNYDQYFIQIIESMKADKTLALPYRNYATADLERVRALVRMARSMTNARPDISLTPSANGLVNEASTYTASSSEVALEGSCSCMPDMPLRKDCPVHGKAL